MPTPITVLPYLLSQNKCFCYFFVVEKMKYHHTIAMLFIALGHKDPFDQLKFILLWLTIKNGKNWLFETNFLFEYPSRIIYKVLTVFYISKGNRTRKVRMVTWFMFYAELISVSDIDVPSGTIMSIKKAFMHLWWRKSMRRCNKIWYILNFISLLSSSWSTFQHSKCNYKVYYNI